MAKTLEIPAIKLEQGGPSKKGSQMYIATIKAKELIDRSQFSVDTWNPGNRGKAEDQGYQREVDEKRARAIGKYLKENPNASFPSALTLSSRKSLTFKSDDGTHGTLVLGDKAGEFPIYIIDGQHRVAGLRHAIEEHDQALGEMEIACTVLSNYEKLEEIRQFYDLNTLQKNVNTALAQQLMRDLSFQDPHRQAMYKEAKELWKVHALNVVDKLNESTDGVWHNKIKVPHIEDKKMKTIVGQISFVTSLRPFFTSFSLPPEKRYEIIQNYWNAIRSVFPDAFTDPKGYVIQKTPGVFSFHMILPTLVVKLGVDNVTEGHFYKMLKAMVDADNDGDLTSDFWRKADGGAGMYGSMKGFKMLADRFLDLLEAAGVTS